MEGKNLVGSLTRWSCSCRVLVSHTLACRSEPKARRMWLGEGPLTCPLLQCESPGASGSFPRTGWSVVLQAFQRLQCPWLRAPGSWSRNSHSSHTQGT